jgi:hypothetical protein
MLVKYTTCSHHKQTTINIPITSSNNSFITLQAASDLEVVAMTCIDFFLPLDDFECPPALAIVVPAGGVLSKARKVDT